MSGLALNSQEFVINSISANHRYSFRGTEFCKGMGCKESKNISPDADYQCVRNNYSPQIKCRKIVSKKKNRIYHLSKVD